MAVLLDTTVLIEAERRRYPLSRVVALADDEEPMAISAVAVAEMLLGIYLSRPSPQREHRERFVERIIDRFDVLAFDLPVARLYAQLWADLRRAGNLIARHDLMVAATALHHGYHVLTDNLRDFERVPSLNVRPPGW